MVRCVGIKQKMSWFIFGKKIHFYGNILNDDSQTNSTESAKIRILRMKIKIGNKPNKRRKILLTKLYSAFFLYI